MPSAFSLTVSLLYITAALFLKRAGQLGGGVLRTTFIADLAVALVFTGLLQLGGRAAGHTLSGSRRCEISELIFAEKSHSSGE